MRLISRDAARRAILAKQGLITPFREPHDAVRAMIAVQTQYASSLPIAVAARTRGVRAGWDDEALAVRGPLVKAWSVRHTLHAHLREDHALLLGAIGARAYARYRRGMMERRGIDAPAMEEEIEATLADGPLTRDELHARLPRLREIDMVGWGLDVMGLAFRGRLCVTGRGSAQCFALLDGGLAEPKLEAVIGRYLASFGPATVHDFSHWSGLPIGEFRDAFELVGDREPVEIEGLKGVRWAVAGTLDDLPTGSLGVRLLAKFDPLILAHRDKSLFLDVAHRERVFRKAGQVEAVVLSEGLAIATWRLERRSTRAFIAVEPFRPLRIRERGRIEREAAATAKKLGLTLGALTMAE